MARTTSWRWTPGAVRAAGERLAIHVDAVVKAGEKETPARIAACNRVARMVLESGVVAQFSGGSSTVAEEAFAAALSRMSAFWMYSPAVQAARTQGLISTRLNGWIERLVSWKDEINETLLAEARGVASVPDGGGDPVPDPEPWRCSVVTGGVRCRMARDHVGGHVDAE